MLQARQSVYVARSSTVVRPLRPSKLSSRPFRAIFGAAAGLLLLSLGCNTYNPYLGASPTVSSSISFINPSGANAAANHPDILLTVFAHSSSAVATASLKTSTLSRAVSATSSVPLQTGTRYQPIVADSGDAAFQTATGITAIFLRDTCLGAPAGCSPQIIPISVGWDGAEPNAASSSPSVTTNGRFAIFASEANNLVKGDSNGWWDIFRRDTCISATSACVPTTIRFSIAPDCA